MTSASQNQSISISELIEQAITAPDDSDERWKAVSHLHKLGTREVFEAARTLCGSSDPLHRSLGADILGQLGWQEKAFHEESVGLLIPMLQDTSLDVVYSAICSLGHRRDPRAVPGLCRLAQHEDDDIRFGVAFAIGSFDGKAATDTKLALMKDISRDVRNWATFAFNVTEDDSPEIREGLRARLEEDDGEIRGEALVALASRRDPASLDATRLELSREFAGDWVIEAATMVGDASLLPGLHRIRTLWSPEDETYFGSKLDEAVRVCQQRKS